MLMYTNTLKAKLQTREIILKHTRNIVQARLHVYYNDRCYTEVHQGNTESHLVELMLQRLQLQNCVSGSLDSRQCGLY